MTKRRQFGIAVVLIVAAVAAGARPASRWWLRHTRDELSAKCRAARDSQQWDDLQRLSADWAARDGGLADPWLFLAQVAEARSDWSAVVDNLAHIPETDPKALPALVEQAKLEFGPLNAPLAGEAACQKLLRLEPRATFAHQRLIQYYAISLQREKLVRQIRAAIDAEREPPEAYVYLLLLDTLRMSNGVELNQHWLMSHPQEEVFAVARAVQIPEPTDDKAAVPPDQLEAVRQAIAGKLELVEALLAKYPTNLELLAYKIEQCITVGETDQVVDLLSRVSESAEADSRFWRFKGWLHETYDELTEAEAAYKQALEIHPLDWSSWNRLAVVYRRMKNVQEVTRLTGLVEAAQSLRKRIRLLPTAEQVTPEILADLAKYASNCGARWLAEPLERRVRQIVVSE